MINVQTQLNGDELTIKVDLSKDFGPSKSGKTISVASTQGNIEIEGKPGYKLGLNIYKSR